MVNRQDSLIWFASAAMLLLMVSIVGYLTVFPVPQENREIVVTILAVLLGGASAAMPNLFGDRETEKLRERIREMERQMTEQRSRHDVEIAALKAANDTLKQQFDQIVLMLIDRHVIKAEGIVGTNNVPSKGS